jgi:hypothetical protein
LPERSLNKVAISLRRDEQVAQNHRQRLVRYVVRKVFPAGNVSVEIVGRWSRLLISAEQDGY